MVQWGTLLSAVIDFLIFLGFMQVYVFPKLRRALDERRKFVADTLAAAEADRREAQRLKEDFARQIDTARAEAKAILERAEKAAQAREEEMLRAAQEEVSRLKHQAAVEINGEKEKALRDLQKATADLSIRIAGKLIGGMMDEERQRQLVDRFMSETGSVQ